MAMFGQAWRILWIAATALASGTTPAAPATGHAPMAVAETTHGLLLTNGSGQGLWLHDGESTALLSRRRGSGGYALERDGAILFRECLEGCHRLVSYTPAGGAEEILRAPTVYGPFPAPEGVLVCLPERVLQTDAFGEVLREWDTAPAPSTAALLGGRLLYTTDDGLLRCSGGDASDAAGHVLAVRAVPGEDMVMLEMADGAALFLDGAGEPVMRVGDASLPTPAPGGAVWARLEGRGAELTGGQIVRAWAAEGRLDTLVRGVPAASPLLGRDGRLIYTDLREGRIPGVEVGPLSSAGSSRGAGDAEAWLDLVPYMHQRWDTPDWFNGSWSCGPTSCMMAAQYYNRLTPDSIWCSYPSPGHWSEWGEYIPNLYTFLGHTYDDWGPSPGGDVQGAHGFICPTGGAWWDLMVQWMDQHGLYSARDSTWTAFTGEVDQGWPMVASTTSPYTSGHILLLNGWFEDHSFVSNDSYGDQNEPGWGDYYNGEDVVYDWYPYDNGNVQITIAQLFYARDSVLAEPDTLVDDYSWGFEKLGPCQYWHEVDAGYSGNAWWTYSTGAPPDTCVVRWNPQLPEAGEYEVSAFIPSQRATATGIYHLETSEGWEEVALDQSLYSDQWAVLGSFGFESEPTVRLGDYTGTGGEYIAFDAIRFHPVASGVEGEAADALPDRSGLALQPNPCRGGAVEVSFPQSLSVESLALYDLSGRAVLRQIPAARGSAVLKTRGLAAGVYLLLAETPRGSVRARLVLLR